MEHSEKAAHWLETAFFAVQMCCFSYITLLAITAPYQNNKWIAPLSFGLVLGTIYLSQAHRERLRAVWDRFTDCFTDKSFLALQCVSFALMLLLAIRLQVENTWDYGIITKNAYLLAKNEPLSNWVYFAEHENNQFLLFLVALYNKAVLFFVPSATMEFCKTAALPLNCLSMECALFVTYRIAELCLGHKKAVVTGLISLSCLPLYLYASILYSDTPSLLPLCLILYFYLRFTREPSMRRYLYLAGYLLASLLGYFLKASIIIGTIATIIDYIFQCLHRSGKGIKTVCLDVLLIAIALALGLSAIQPGFDSILGITPEDCDAHRFPKYHYIMMGLNDSGGYSQDDVDFTKSWPTMQQRQDQDIAKIKERINMRGQFGTCSHILYTKLRRTWAWPTCAGDYYAGRQPVSPGLAQEIFTTNPGRYYKISALYAAWWWFLVLIGFTRSAWKHFKGSRTLFAPHLIIFGCLLFFSIWECNPRYLLTFLPILCLCAADGLLDPH